MPQTVGRVPGTKGFYACSISGDGVFLAGGGGGGKVVLSRIVVPASGVFPFCPKIREPAVADSGTFRPVPPNRVLFNRTRFLFFSPTFGSWIRP